MIVLLEDPVCLLPVPEADALVIEAVEEPDDEPLDEAVAEAEDNEDESKAAAETAVNQLAIVRCCPCSCTYRL